MRQQTDSLPIPPGKPSLPKYARLPVNRCNYPAIILGSITFQQHPEALFLDHVLTFNRYLFDRLDVLETTEERAQLFDEYMQVSFLLGHPDEVGFQESRQKIKRHKLDYKKILRGWMFDSDSREGAVLKGWVESRFGLVTRNHKGPIKDQESKNHLEFTQERCQGLYNTNGIESQLDLLYTFCQYELQRRSAPLHFKLYRGTNSLSQYDSFSTDSGKTQTVLLNNLTSFSDDQTISDSFGDHVVSCSVPFSKLFYFPGLLPNILKCEKEYLVLGGMYQIGVI
ncbi:MAG: NAD(+)--dinitrogen-reductase ADP-D-ribosyltransferase [Neptuniibacter sp.]